MTIGALALGVLYLLTSGAAGTVLAKGSAEDERPWIGVVLQNMNDAMREALNIEPDVGVLVAEVVEDSPAEKAGLEVGDVIVEFNERTIEDSDDLRRAVRRTEPGDKVKMVIIRDGKRRTLTVEVGEKPRSRRRVYGRGWQGRFPFVFGFGARTYLGVELAELNPDLAAYFRVEEGALVLDIDRGSPADEAGLRPGDVIVALEGEKVGDPEELFEILEDYEEGDEVEIEVIRQGKRKKMSVELEERPRWRRHRFSDLPRFFYFYNIPDADDGGWGWEWDWDWEPPHGEGFIRILPWWGREDEIGRKLDDAGERLHRAILRLRSVL